MPFFKVNSMEEVTEKGFDILKISMEYSSENLTECPSCGEKLYKHDSRTVKITDTPMLGKPAKLILNIPRRRCKNQDCKYIWTPTLNEIDDNHLMTKRAYKTIVNGALKRSFEDLSEEYALSPSTIKNTFVDFIREEAEYLHFTTPFAIGLDEIKIKKLGELTVITDLEHRTLYDMLQGRNQEELTEYFYKFPDADKVKWVCTDMYRPFRKSIESALPNARWVIDHFHVVAYANRAIDSIRREIQNNLSKSNRIKTKKGLAYTLRKRFKDLDSEEASKIKYCRSHPDYAPLAMAYDLKEDFFNIYDDNPSSKDNAMKAFEEWEKTIPEDEIYEPFRELAKTVHNFYEEIFNRWDCPFMISNGFTECTNRIIRENNVRGRGNSFEILKGRTLYRKSNMERLIQSNMVKDTRTLVGPPIPKKGAVFHFEETNNVSEEAPEAVSNTYNSFVYDPFIGLKPYEDYDPETGEIYEDWEDND